MVTKQINFYGGHIRLCGQPDIPGVSKEGRDGGGLKARKSCPGVKQQHLIQRGEGQLQCSEPGSGEDTFCLLSAKREEAPSGRPWRPCGEYWLLV